MVPFVESRAKRLKDNQFSYPDIKLGSMRHTLLTTLFGLVLAALTTPTVMAASKTPAAFVASGQSKVDAVGRKVYIVQLAGSGAVNASHKGPQSARKSGYDSGRIAAKASQLQIEQNQIVQKLGPGVEILYHYRYSINGFAARMTPSQAQAIRRLPGVQAVWEDSKRKVATNESPTFLGLFDEDDGLIGALDLRGEDIVIGTIDSGITPEHPSFSDFEKAPGPRLCETSFGETFLGLWLCRRYEKRPPVQTYEELEGWTGICQAGEDFEADACNNKLIGARFFVAGAMANLDVADNEILSPRDADGHGPHIASTAAGNRVTAKINGANVARIQGIAPRARISAYKACWLKPSGIRASCNTSDLTQAIDMAVADGVDIISYSIGNDTSNVSSVDSLALLEATKAGIFTAVAAGNDGPSLGTVGSPGSSPWVTTVAASSRRGDVFEEAIEVLAPGSVAGKIAARQANFTPTLADTGTIEDDLVRVDDGSLVTDTGTDNGSNDDGCQAFDNAADVSGKIAYLRRSGCAFLTKVRNASDAGAKAVVVFSNTGAPVIMTSINNEQADIPAVMIGQSDGDRLLDQLAEDQVVSVRLANGLFLSATDDGNFIAGFSSRGPALGAPDIMKPDVTAPGINILAALSPTQANGPKGVEYGYLSGTSMSTPHVAGVAALLREAHPDWSPATLRSALMTSAYTDSVFRDANVGADALDMGAGHIDANEANKATLVYDAGALDYDAYGCGLATPIADAARCQEVESAGFSTQAADFNQPSVTVFKLTEPRTIRRTVTNLGPAGTWTAQLQIPNGFSISVQPATLTLSQGESATFEITVSQAASQLDAWYFGRLSWVGDSGQINSPIALKAASVDAPAEVFDAGGAGSADIPVRFGYTGPYTAGVHGLVAPNRRDDFVANDPDKAFGDNACPDTDPSVICFEHIVSPQQLYLRVALFDEFTDGNDDLDLFVYYCPNGIGGFCPEVGVSGEATSEESVNIVAPPAGTYLVLVHGFDTDETTGGPGANFSLFTWDLFGVNAAGQVLADPAGNLSVNAPSAVTAGSRETLIIDWSDLDPDQRYLGAISHNTPEGTPGLTIVNIRN